eukprot:ctg_129.g108
MGGERKVMDSRGGGRLYGWAVWMTVGVVSSGRGRRGRPPSGRARSRLRTRRAWRGQLTATARVLISPLGYVGAAVACALRSARRRADPEAQPYPEVQVAGVYRDEYERATLQKVLPANVQLLGRSRDWMLQARHATHLLLGDLRTGEQVCAAADALSDVQWLGCFSSVGVYAEDAGGWVTESSPLLAAADMRDAVRECCALEGRARQLAAHWSVPCCIFRLGAVYGPTPSAVRGRRGWNRRSVLDGLDEQADAPDDGVLVNRIHVADVARWVRQALHLRSAGVFNLVDAEPATRTQVLRYARERCLQRLQGCHDTLADDSHSPEGSAAASRRRRRPVRSKRVSHARAIHELLDDHDRHLLFPAFREGLTAIAQGNMEPFAYSVFTEWVPHPHALLALLAEASQTSVRASCRSGASDVRHSEVLSPNLTVLLRWLTRLPWGCRVVDREGSRITNQGMAFAAA